jgi:phosphate acetyltransferase
MTGSRNVTFDEIAVGNTASVTRPVTEAELEAMALVSSDVDLRHLTPDGGERGGPRTAPAVGAVAPISWLINRRLPGPGSRILAQDLRFAGAVGVGGAVTASIAVREKRAGSIVVFDCLVSQEGEQLVAGTITVQAPTRRITWDEGSAPEVLPRRDDAFGRLLRRCQGLAPVACAVVHPCDRDSLLGALDAARRGLITPVLVGPEAKIRAVAAAEGVDLSSWSIVSTEHSHAAAEKAVALARAGTVEALMKGSLHTDELMGAVVPSATGLRTARRISHAYLMDVPAYPRPLLVTDAAINIAPTLEDKADIAQNAIDLAHVLGIAEPRVAILSAVETVTPKLQSTVDAAALCKMADRGQITGGLLDGPLAFDNAISEEAARTKKIVSPVAGRADILLVPDLEAGNMLAKQLQYLAGADSAGIVLGTRVPIVLTSRADSVRTRIASAAVMALVADARRAKPGLAAGS